MTLRARLGMLRGIYGPVMPYRDPHTAGPALSRAATTRQPTLPGLGCSHRWFHPVAQGAEVRGDQPVSPAAPALSYGQCWAHASGVSDVLWQYCQARIQGEAFGEERQPASKVTAIFPAWLP